MAKILLYSNDIIGQKMAGPGIRYVQLAKALAKNHTVLLVAPAPSSFSAETFQFQKYQKPKQVVNWLKNCQIIIGQKLPPVLLRRVLKNKIKYIADFYDPIVMENLEANRAKSWPEQAAIYQFEMANQNLQLAAADHILVASERQRDFWFGVLMEMGRIVPEVYSEDVSLKNLFSILPFGISKEKVGITDPEAMKNLVPNYTKKDKIVLWGGGIWNWFDPLSVIEAIKKLEKSHPEIKLLFLGLKHPNPDAPEMEMAAKAVKLATEMGLTDKRVFFNYQWVPYEERANYVFQSWVGISTHFDHMETRISFRTRIVDSYFWAGLPIVATSGDSMADLIEKESLGEIVGYTEANQIEQALIKLAENEEYYNQCQDNILKIKKEFYWENLVKPLNELIEAKAWTNIQLEKSSLNQLIKNYYRAGLNKVLVFKGWPGVLKKILPF